LISLAILFNFLCAQHVSDINISIIRSLRLFYSITTLVVLQAEACNTDNTPTQPHRNSNTHRTKNNKINVVIQQNSRMLLMMDILTSETCWAHKKLNKIASDIKLVFYSTITQCSLVDVRWRFRETSISTLVKKAVVSSENPVHINWTTLWYSIIHFTTTENTSLVIHFNQFESPFIDEFSESK